MVYETDPLYSSLLGLSHSLPIRSQFVVRGYAGLRLPRRITIVVQLDIVRLEALHKALHHGQLHAHDATHRQRSGGRRVAALALCRLNELSLAPESNFARRLVLRGFPKVKSASRQSF